jgi:uncharacterized iron-regulated membrane protein
MRKALFWIHLSAGSAAGMVILIMSVTGLLLAYERQIIAWAGSGYRTVPPSPTATRLPLEALLGEVHRTQPADPTTLTLRADPAAPVEVALGRDRTFFVDPYTGAVLGESSPKLRAFFHEVEGWHRWLGAPEKSRTITRAVTGACNLVFLFLVITGFYLWWPRQWSWRRLRPAILFQRRVTGKARDWNWHNVAGFWCAVPLFFVVLTAVVMSYPWANNLLYRATGNEPPARGALPGQRSGAAEAQRKGPKRREGDGPRRREGALSGMELGSHGSGRGGRRTAGDPPGSEPPSVNDSSTDMAWSALDQLCVRAGQQVSGWKSIILRVPTAGDAPVIFFIDQGDGGRPDKRSQLALDRKTGEVVRWEPFSSYNLGRRLRSWVRWVHTGEAGGVAGQTLAAIASTGGSLLAWTGLALAWRRFQAWRARRRYGEPADATEADSETGQALTAVQRRGA